MKNLSSFGFSLLLPLAIFLSSLSVAHSQEDDFQAAGVDIQRVFQEFYKTTRTERNINEKRIQTQKVDHQSRILLKGIQGKISNEKKVLEEGSLSEEEKIKQKEKIDLMVAERDKFNEQRAMQLRQSDEQLNQDMMKIMLGLLDEIHRFVEAHAERSGYDIVFDTSGTLTNQFSPVLGGKGILDITATVITELNREDPALKEKQ